MFYNKWVILTNRPSWQITNQLHKHSINIFTQSTEGCVHTYQDLPPLHHTIFSSKSFRFFPLHPFLRMIYVVGLQHSPCGHPSEPSMTWLNGWAYFYYMLRKAANHWNPEIATIYHHSQQFSVYCAFSNIHFLQQPKRKGKQHL